MNSSGLASDQHVITRNLGISVALSRCGSWWPGIVRQQKLRGQPSLDVTQVEQRHLYDHSISESDLVLRTDSFR